MSAPCDPGLALEDPADLIVDIGAALDITLA